MGVWAVAVLVLCLGQETQLEEGKKVSISIKTSPNQKKPYFATFDSTPFITWQWSQGAVSGVNNELPSIPVLREEDFSRALHRGGNARRNLLVETSTPTPSPRDFASSSLWNQVTPYNVMQFLNLNKPFVFAALCDCPRDQEFIVKMRQVEDLLRQGLRDGFSDRFVFLWSLPQTSDRFQVKSVFALTDKDLPALVIDNIPVGANVEKYRFEPTLEATRKEFSAQDVIDFLSDFLRQKLKLLVRSAPIPTQDNVDQPGKVIEVVADTFEKIILDQDHTYLVLIYSPSCGGSIAVQPIMQQLAEEIKNNPELRVARFDGTVNDVPVRGLHYHHYPTAFLFLKNQKFKEDGSINALDWDDFNGSKEMHSRNVPVILLPFKSHRNSILTLKKTLWSSLSLRKCRVNTDTSGRPLVA